MHATVSMLSLAGSSWAVISVARASESGSPWGEVVGGVGVLVAIGLFLRHMGELKKEHHETVRKAHETICVQADKHATSQARFAASIEDVTTRFSETAVAIQKQANEANAALLHEAREAHAKCEETIHGLLKGRREPERKNP